MNKQTVNKEIWVLLEPDNEHWDSKEAKEELARLSQRWDVEIEANPYKTRDGGFGFEQAFVLTGTEENIKEFEEELNNIFY